jgi:DNA polymerase-3 subunit beta
MNISCTQENLHQGLLVVSPLASKSVSLPVLQNILIQATDNVIKLSATNLELGVRCTIRGKIEIPGEITVQAKLLADYIALLPKERVDVVVTENKESGDTVAAISCGNHNTKIKVQSATEFPVIPSITKATPYRLHHVALRQALSQVLFAVSNNETRPEITGVAFQAIGSKLVLASTDSYRLAEKSIAIDAKPSESDTTLIVPAKTLQEVSRILGSFKDPAAIAEIEFVDVYVTDNQIVFSFGDIELTSRLLDGQYPDYRQIIPQSVATKATLDVSELVKATKTTSLFARSGMYDITLDVDPASATVAVASTNSQVGESTSKITADISGPAVQVVLNYRYVLDGLQNIGTEQVQIGIQDAASPCVLRPVNKKDDATDYTYIIMPIRQ